MLAPARPHGLLRRIALWGAGTDGEYLAWGGPVRPAEKPAADRPVVLREMPSTPTIQHPHDPARGDFPRCGAVSPRSGVDRTAVDAAGPPWSSGRPRRKTEWTA